MDYRGGPEWKRQSFGLWPHEKELGAPVSIAESQGNKSAFTICGRKTPAFWFGMLTCLASKSSTRD